MTRMEQAFTDAKPAQPEPQAPLAPLDGFAGRCGKCGARLKTDTDIALHGPCSETILVRSQMQQVINQIVETWWLK